MGLMQPGELRGATLEEVKQACRDAPLRRFFANAVVYFILISTASTLFRAGGVTISTPTEAAQALRPVAGDAAGLLFAVGLVAVGFLAIPVMSAGAEQSIYYGRADQRSRTEFSLRHHPGGYHCSTVGSSSAFFNSSKSSRSERSRAH